jgi:hypothetical protein
LAEVLFVDTSLIVTAVDVDHVDMEKSFCILGRLQSSSIDTRVLLPAATEIELNDVVPKFQTRVYPVIETVCVLLP